MRWSVSKVLLNHHQRYPGLTDVELTEMTVEHWVMIKAPTGDTQQIWESLNAAGAWPAETFIEGAADMVFYVYDTKNLGRFQYYPLRSGCILLAHDGKVQKSYLNGRQVPIFAAQVPLSSVKTMRQIYSLMER